MPTHKLVAKTFSLDFKTSINVRSLVLSHHCSSMFTSIDSIAEHEKKHTLIYLSTMKKSIVDHTYQDHSQDVVENYQGSNTKLFPAKLHEIVSTPEYQHIIAWKPHGRAWALVDKSLFISVVLPKHFNHSNFGSFNRSVNGWGFKVCYGHYPL